MTASGEAAPSSRVDPAAVAPLLSSPDSSRRLRPGSGGNPALDRLAELAARLLATPSSQVSLLSDVQTVAGGAGLPAGAVGGDSPLDDSLCTVTASRGGPARGRRRHGGRARPHLPPVVVGRGRVLPRRAARRRRRAQSVGALCVCDPAAPRRGPTPTSSCCSSSAAPRSPSSSSPRSARRVPDTLDRWELAIDAAGVGSFDWDLATGELLWDDRLLGALRLRARGRSPAPSRPSTRGSTPTTCRAVRAGARQASPRAASSTARVPRRAPRRAPPAGSTARGRALRGRRRQRRAHARRGVRHDRRRTTARRASAGCSSRCRRPSTRSTTTWRFTYVNAEAERLLGRPREELLGGVIWELFPAAVGSDFEANYRAVRETAASRGRSRPTTPRRWTAGTSCGSGRRRTGWSVYFLDITARRAAQASCTARCGARLRRRRDRRPVRHARRRGGRRPPGAAARARRSPTGASSRSSTTTAGCATSAGRTPTRDLQEVAASATPSCAWQSLKPTSYVSAAPAHRARRSSCTDDATGAGSSSRARAGRGARPAAAQLAPASAVDPADAGPRPHRRRCSRSSTAATRPRRRRGRARDRARRRGPGARSRSTTPGCTQQQRQLAEELQRSLLTAPPEPDHVAGRRPLRSRPREAAQVGGDWYDAFLQPDGATDARHRRRRRPRHRRRRRDGAGPRAAARHRRSRPAGPGGRPAPGSTRPSRALQVGHHRHRRRRPARADAATSASGTSPTCAGPTPATRRRWSCTPTATSLVLAGVEADLLLGIDPSSPRVESRGDARPRQRRCCSTPTASSSGAGRASTTASPGCATRSASSRELPLDELCDALLDRLLPPPRDDDVALVAVRLHPQDRPRPGHRRARAPGPRRGAGRTCTVTRCGAALTTPQDLQTARSLLLLQRTGAWAAGRRAAPPCHVEQAGAVCS